VFVALAGGIGWPFVLSRVAPIEPTLVSLFAFTTLAAIVAVLGYRHQPPRSARAGRYVAPRAAKASRPRATSPWQTGFTLLAWHEVRTSVGIIVALLGAAVLYWVAFESDTSLRSFANAGRLLPFASLPADANSLSLPFVMLMTVSTWFRRFTTDIRRFRVLPLSGRQLAGVLCGFSLLSAAVIWLALLVVHVALVGGVPVTLRLDLFLVAASCFALARTLELLAVHPVASSAAGGLAVLPAMVVAGVASSHPAIGARVALMTVGAAVLTFAFLLASRLLRRSSRVYKRRPSWPPLVNPQPGA
jgi:hypothetical protein